MERNGQNFLSFWTIFCPFTPLTAQKIKILKNEKKKKKSPRDIIILHKCTEIMIIRYTVPEVRRVTDVVFIFHFGLFFALLPPLTTQKLKI